MLGFNQLIKVTRVYVFPTGSYLDNSNNNNSFLVSCLQSDKLCISKSLVRHLENLTPYLGLATCVAFLTLSLPHIKSSSNVDHPLKRLLSERIINTCKTLF